MINLKIIKLFSVFFLLNSCSSNIQQITSLYNKYGITSEPTNSVAYSKYKTFTNCFLPRSNFVFKEFAICTIGESEYKSSDLFDSPYFENINSFQHVENYMFDVCLPEIINEEHRWSVVTFKNEYLIKDAFELYEVLENKTFVCFIYELMGGSGTISDTVRIESEQNKMSDAIKVFDFEHDGFIDGYYKDIYLAVKHEFSLSNEYTAEELLPSTGINRLSSFNKIKEESIINELNDKLPQESYRIDRDWYRFEFSFRYEAQFAFSLLKTLEFMDKSYYAFAIKCEDIDVPIGKVKLIHPFSL